MSLFKKTKERLKQLNVDPKRSLGQNFLVNAEVVQKIMDAVIELKPASVIEVGPGLGALTDSLLSLGVPMHVLELDREFADFWRGQGVSVTEGDALKFDWSRLTFATPALLVSNLPYQISTHIIVDRTFGPLSITGMILMFQKEVAERVLAKPNSSDYGAMSVMMQTHWQISKVVEAGPKSFFPSPKVVSLVLRFDRHPSPVAGREKAFFSFLKVAFAQRRKILAKNLLALGGVKAEHVNAALTELAIAPKARAQELSVQEFVKLFGMLQN